MKKIKITRLQRPSHSGSFFKSVIEIKSLWEETKRYMKIHNPVVVGIALIFLIDLSSCNNSEDDILLDNNGTVVKQPHLWETSMADNGDLSQVVITTPILYGENNLLVGSSKNSNRVIFSLNAMDGTVNWQWNDLLSLQSDPTYKDPISLRIDSYHQNNGKLFFTYTGSSYCLDLESGQTVWKYKEYRHRFDRNSGIDNTYFTSGANYEPIDDEKIYVGDIESSTPEQLLLSPEYTSVDNPVGTVLGRITDMTAFKNNNVTYLAFGIENAYTDFTTKEGMGSTELNLYNITESKYEYKRVVTNPSRDTRVVADIFYQAPNLYYQSSNYIHGVEAMTGQERWRTFIGSAPITSRMILADNKLYSACEDRFLYCLDINTGRLLWKEQNTGSCSELSYLNGVLYYLGGGLLHAVDAETGKHLWKVSSPDLKITRAIGFYGLCVVVPGNKRDNGDKGDKGVVVATTLLHIYAYEAIR